MKNNLKTYENKVKELEAAETKNPAEVKELETKIKFAKIDL